jgi:hypothetical protein
MLFKTQLPSKKMLVLFRLLATTLLPLGLTFFNSMLALCKMFKGLIPKKKLKSNLCNLYYMWQF